jgi:glutathione synthase/RimK-type ligase-like ATP-grasp enzyme
LGLRIPKTIISNDPDSVRDFFQSNMGDIVAKTLRQSHGSFDGREYVIYTNPILESDLQRLESVKFAPVIFQERIEKASDIRVTVVGSDVFATEIHSQANSSTSVDWRRNTLSLRHTPHQLPAEIEERCLRLVESYGLVFGALDLIKTPSSEYVFLELNPNGQWAWIEVLTHQPITEKLIHVLAEPENQT